MWVGNVLCSCTVNAASAEIIEYTLSDYEFGLNHDSSYYLWGDSMSWPGGMFPVKGAGATIEGTWRTVLDISPPALGTVYIFGYLKFQDRLDLNISANIVSIPFAWNCVAYTQYSRQVIYMRYSMRCPNIFKTADSCSWT